MFPQLRSAISIVVILFMKSSEEDRIHSERASERSPSRQSNERYIPRHKALWIYSDSLQILFTSLAGLMIVASMSLSPQLNS